MFKCYFVTEELDETIVLQAMDLENIILFFYFNYVS